MRALIQALLLAFLLPALLSGVGSAYAQTTQPFVETYIDGAVPPADPGVLKGPLKAGDLVLPRASKSKDKTPPKKSTASLPVGTLKAPQLSEKPVTAPKAAPKGSAASDMLMQGLKNALTQVGQNPELPASGMDPVASAGALKAPVLPTTLPETVPAPVETPVAAPAAEEAVPSHDFFAQGEIQGEIEAEVAARASDAAGLLVEAGAESVPTPKATEIDEPPVPLDQAEAPAAASIFGQPVAEKRDGANASCDPVVTPWTKACSEAGYPASFEGKITGESRVVCPAGDIQDVWLTNSCSPPATAETTAPEPRATEMLEEPSTLTRSSRESEPKKEPDHTTRIDGSCGSANGLATLAKPVGDLCALGQPSDVSGEGPWRWSCQGWQGGMSVSCAAPVGKGAIAASKNDTMKEPVAGPVVEDGKCGTASDTGTDVAPTQNLCVKGIAGRVNGSGPWTWACSGTNGGSAASCTAPLRVDGTCGAANNAGADRMPSQDLCLTGFASAVTGKGPWNWTCSGLYGGSAATCSASARENAVCGEASLSGHRQAPSEKLCRTGSPSDVSGDGPWTWSCSGSNGGAAVSCKAPTLVDGLCGEANGMAFAETPDADLCAQGAPTRVTGLGPWNWNCSGLDGGMTVSCTAPLGSKEEVASRSVTCGPAAEAAAFMEPTEGLCLNGKPGDVRGEGPWSWACTDRSGLTISCSTLSSSAGVCGRAANTPSSEPPALALCASGTPGAVEKSKFGWIWPCRGALGGDSVKCTAPIAEKKTSAAVAPSQETKTMGQALCGKAAGRASVDAPTTDLCEAGKSTAVRGIGPWSWTCGTKTGPKVVCEAPKVVDGICGAANGSIQKTAPLGDLCVAGNPTPIEGAGPWLWSCVGAGGGSSVSCSATPESMTKIDGSCGAAGNSVMTSAPKVNLCDTGMASAVHGEGPWTWTCSGVNGGIASTCTTSKVLPKAPPPPGPVLNGVCGPASGVAMEGQPLEGLCSSGTTTEVSGDGPWNWSCIGANGGMTVSCTAPLMPPDPVEGVCGPASGVTTMTIPKSGLCSAGISSAVSGKGPWTWSCSGTNGGGAVSCVAPMAGLNNTGIPSLVTPSVGSGTTLLPTRTMRGSDAGDAPVPKAAPVGLVTPQLPAGPLPPLESGTLPQLKPSKPLALSKNLAPTPTAKKLAGSSSLPDQAPALPEGAEPLPPPPVRDGVAPAPSVKTPAVASDDLVATGRLELPEEVATMAFKRGSSALTEDALVAAGKLADILKANAGTRVTLVAYADNSNITPREARRLSLARALAIRDVLTSKGLSSSRIDVRALGANVPSGDMDRVDVKVN